MVYFLHGEQVSPAPRAVIDPATATAAVRALLNGPSCSERDLGHVATVDLSGRYDGGSSLWSPG
ncbi:hypothetical protein ACGF5O_01275 [Streptomyces sp. NPDC048291]|uniref:hypothetical protein n=1 Tax=Streptomyces sp. NPDC048291 TaxID=3365530 RepID=UPI00371BD215